MDDILELNGYDEKFDACRGLEDCDFGMRLKALRGERPNFLLDKRLWVIEHHHAPLDSAVLPKEQKPFKANFPLLRRNQYSGEFRVNTRVFGEKDAEWLRTPPVGQDAVFHKDWELFAWDDPEFRTWWENAPNFDLREQRRRLRAGEDPWSR